MGTDNLFHKNKMRTKKELARRAAAKSGELIAIICEGTKTEVNYFQGFCKFYRLSNIKAIPSTGTDPSSIVEYAFEFARNHPEIDKIFCVFDHDGREKACKEAIKSVKLHKPKYTHQKFEVILSTPCFEVWLLLHFPYSSKPHLQSRKGYHTKSNIVTELRKCYPSYQKNLTNLFNELQPRLKTALINAKKLKSDVICHRRFQYIELSD